jgi:hypothetical protein
MIQMKITLLKDSMNALQREAENLGITANVLARIHLNQIYGKPDDSGKSYIVKLENWREIEAYIKARGFRDMGAFLSLAAGAYMKKNHLSAAQKANA